MNWARWYPSAAMLGEGRMIAFGGEITEGVIAETPEVYDPATNTWTQLPGAKLNVGEYPLTYLYAQRQDLYGRRP
jgi:hypothetical protein